MHAHLLWGDWPYPVRVAKRLTPYPRSILFRFSFTGEPRIRLPGRKSPHPGKRIYGKAKSANATDHGCSADICNAGRSGTENQRAMKRCFWQASGKSKSIDSATNIQRAPFCQRTADAVQCALQSESIGPISPQSKCACICGKGNRSRPLPVAGGGRRRFWLFSGDCRAV